jgi:hypothetical protein
MEYTNSQIRAIIEEHIHSKRDREILCMRLIDGLCYDQIAAEYQLTPRQIKNIVYKSEALVFAKFPK